MIEIVENTSLDNIEKIRSEMDKAKSIANTLVKHYDGYLWVVYVQSNVFVVKNLDISDRYGFVIPCVAAYGDPRNRLAVQAGGEMLERAHLPRSKFTGQQAKQVDGVKWNHQPVYINGHKVQ